MLHDVGARAHDLGLLPHDPLAVFVGGSMARGWQHARSDVDIYVICEHPWTGQADGRVSVRLDPDRVPTRVLLVDGRRWEVRYWLESQVDQLLAKVSWPGYERGTVLMDLTRSETALLDRLPQVAVLRGQQWVDRRRVDLAATAYQKIVVTEYLDTSDSLAEAAVGLLEVGEYAGAVSATRASVCAAIDALLFSLGEPGRQEKWRARRLAEVKADSVTSEQYWEFETMRHFDEANPRAWTEASLQWRTRIVLDIDIEVA